MQLRRYGRFCYITLCTPKLSNIRFSLATNERSKTMWTFPVEYGSGTVGSNGFWLWTDEKKEYDYYADNNTVYKTGLPSQG